MLNPNRFLAGEGTPIERELFCHLRDCKLCGGYPGCEEARRLEGQVREQEDEVWGRYGSSRQRVPCRDDTHRRI